MAILINGNGNQAIYAAQDADLIASICGGVTSIAQVGNEFAYDLLDANTIGVKDGVILTKEGRRIQLDIDNIDEFAIPNGQQGTTSYYIIGYKLVTDAESKQTAQTFVQLMENGTDTIPEDTFRGGADEVYVSLYRVTQDGLNIDTVDLLLPKLSNINGINADLSVFSFRNNNGVAEYSMDDGTTWTKIGGGGMPSLNFSNPLHTFNSGNLSYTATKECYLAGSMHYGGSVGAHKISINGTIYAVSVTIGSEDGDVYIPPLKLNSGDVVVASAPFVELHVYEEV